MNEKIAELLHSPISENRELGRVLQKEEELKRRRHLHILRVIQAQYPEVIVSGSTALYLHGIRLSRFNSTRGDVISDLDIIIPYYILFESNDYITYEREQSRSRSNDYDYGMTVSLRTSGTSGISSGNIANLDVRIDNKQAYEYIEMDDFRYKVSLIEDIVAAKIKYIREGTPDKRQKHKQDVYEILGKVTIPTEVEREKYIWEGS